MYHSLTINGKNTWTDYHMVPVGGIYLPPPPEQKIITIDLQAANSNIDVSELLTGYPVFNNREGEAEYYFLEPYEYGATTPMPSAYESFSQLMADIHGQTGTMYFEDDPNWEYRGRFHVYSYDTTSIRRSVTIKYNVFPYKIDRTLRNVTLPGLGDDIWNTTTLTPTTLGIMPNNPTVSVTGLSEGADCRVRIQYTDSQGNNISGKYIDKTITSTDPTNKTWADFLFYRYAKLLYKGPENSTCVYSFKPGRF